MCNSCASLAGLVLRFITCFILLVIAPLDPRKKPARLPDTKPTYRPLPHKCETHITSVYPVGRLTGYQPPVKGGRLAASFFSRPRPPRSGARAIFEDCDDQIRRTEAAAAVDAMRQTAGLSMLETSWLGVGKPINHSVSGCAADKLAAEPSCSR